MKKRLLQESTKHERNEQPGRAAKNSSKETTSGVGVGQSAVPGMFGRFTDGGDNNMMSRNEARRSRKRDGSSSKSNGFSKKLDGRARKSPYRPSGSMC